MPIWSRAMKKLPVAGVVDHEREDAVEEPYELRAEFVVEVSRGSQSDSVWNLCGFASFSARSFL